jgi:anti-sigma regulatory factor (Ser/Thr protein kinase)
VSPRTLPRFFVEDALRLTLTTDLGDMTRVSAAVATLRARHAHTARAAFVIELAAEEMALNVMKHAFDTPARQTFEVALGVEAGAAVLRIEDAGRPFDPLAAPAPSLSASLEERQVGGLGIHLVRSLVPDLSYHRRPSRLIPSTKESTHGLPHQPHPSEVPRPEEDRRLVRDGVQLPDHERRDAHVR